MTSNTITKACMTDSRIASETSEKIILLVSVDKCRVIDRCFRYRTRSHYGFRCKIKSQRIFSVRKWSDLHVSLHIENNLIR